MEYIEGCELYQEIKSHQAAADNGANARGRGLEEAEAREYFRQIAQGVRYM